MWSRGHRKERKRVGMAERKERKDLGNAGNKTVKKDYEERIGKELGQACLLPLEHGGVITGMQARILSI